MSGLRIIEGSGLDDSHYGDRTKQLLSEVTDMHGITMQRVFGLENRLPEHGHRLQRTIITIAPNVQSPALRHNGATTELFVLSGHGAIVNGDEQYMVANGDNVFVPADTPYQLIAFGDGLQLLCDHTAARGHEDDPNPLQRLIT